MHAIKEFINNFIKIHLIFYCVLVENILNRFYKLCYVILFGKLF